MIPQPDVLDGVAIRLDIGARQLGIPGKLTRTHGVEIARRVDSILWSMCGVSACAARWGHDETLNRCGVERAADGRDQIEHDGGRQQQSARATALCGSADAGQISTSTRSAGRAITSAYEAPCAVPAPATVVNGWNIEVPMHNARKMPPASSDRCIRALPTTGASALGEVQRARQHISRADPANEKINSVIRNCSPSQRECQTEHIKADVVAKDRIHDAERLSFRTAAGAAMRCRPPGPS